MRDVHGYSLWLCPEENVLPRIRRWMSSLESTFDSPAFEPHITILGEIENAPETLIRFASRMAEVLLPCEVNFKKITYSSDYFRALALEAALPGSILQARSLLCAEIGKTDLPYNPHLSLLYGEFSENEKKAAFETLHLRLPLALSFGKLKVVKTEGEVSSWKSLATTTVLGIKQGTTKEAL